MKPQLVVVFLCVGVFLCAAWYGVFSVRQGNISVAFFGVSAEAQAQAAGANQPPEYPTAANPIVARVYDATGAEAEVAPSFVSVNGKVRVTVAEPKSRFRPGRYTLKVWMLQDNVVYFTESQFIWGVFALNFDKSIYTVGDTARVQMGVLTDEGNTVCDAVLRVTFTTPGGESFERTTDGGGIVRNTTCGRNNVTSEPDYETSVPISEGGTYQVRSVVTNVNGTREFSDSFEAQATPAFDVSRVGPTRIYPPATYGMSITVRANQDFAGDIVETLPLGFVVSTIGRVETTPTEQRIIWPLDFRSGDQTELSYAFDAPDVSPELYKLGPLQIGAWRESRQWQIASDAGNTVIFVSSTASTTWVVPDDWNNASNSIEVIGAGGGGSTYNAGGGGGGGGAYASVTNVELPLGSPVGIHIGAGGGASAKGGDTWLCTATSNCTTGTSTAVVVSAEGGRGAAAAAITAGAGGAIINGSGTVESAGGPGGNGSGGGLDSGGGGGGAGSPFGTGGTGGAGAINGAEEASGGGGAAGNNASTSDNGTIGSANGGKGGNSLWAVGGAGGTNTSGFPGSLGSGGGGADDSIGEVNDGGPGGSSTERIASTGEKGGPGGGGGGADDDTAGANGGNGGLYGGGGGGGDAAGAGADGVIIITYTPVPASPPTVSNVVVNGGTAITLNVNATKTVSVSFTVDDLNGCSNVFSGGNVTTTLYRSGVSSTCGVINPTAANINNLNCYVTNTQTNNCSAGTSANATATFDVWYFAQATDNSSSYSAQNWSAFVFARDNSNATGSASSAAAGVELNTLIGIDVANPSFSYPILAVGENTSSTNRTSTIKNTGNSSSTYTVWGTALSSGANLLATSSQHYGTSTFTYGGAEQALQEVATAITGFFLTAATSTSGASSTIYWGVGASSSAATGAYSSTITYTAAWAP